MARRGEDTNGIVGRIYAAFPVGILQGIGTQESPESLLALLDQLGDVRLLQLTAWPPFPIFILLPDALWPIGDIDTVFGI